jgi:hypothetical protein
MLERIAGGGAVSWKYQHSDNKLREAFIITRHFYSHGGSFSPCLFFTLKGDIPRRGRHVRKVPKADVQFPPSGYSTHPSDSAFAHSGRPFASARADADAQS